MKRGIKLEREMAQIARKRRKEAERKIVWVIETANKKIKRICIQRGSFRKRDDREKKIKDYGRVG